MIHHRLIDVAGELSTTLTQAITQNGPLAIAPKQDTPFAQRLCRAVAGQQLSVKAASSIWSRVLGQVPVDMAMVDYLADAAPDSLKGCGLSGAKVRTLGEIAQAAQAGKLNAEALGQLDHTARTQHLTALWGVGQWTADMMGIFYFGDTDIWPDGDVTARKTLEKLTSKRRKTTRTAARFEPYRSYLAFHMWQHADATPP
ncbi:MAG: DNA-3-methyladenine glycosylase 2 family protein [Cyanobacteria bacterium P01_F01_bin.53]